MSPGKLSGRGKRRSSFDQETHSSLMKKRTLPVGGRDGGAGAGGGPPQRQSAMSAAALKMEGMHGSMARQVNTGAFPAMSPSRVDHGYGGGVVDHHTREQEYYHVHPPMMHGAGVVYQPDTQVPQLGSPSSSMMRPAPSPLFPAGTLLTAKYLSAERPDATSAIISDQASWIKEERKRNKSASPLKQALAGIDGRGAGGPGQPAGGGYRPPNSSRRKNVHSSVPAPGPRGAAGLDPTASILTTQTFLMVF